MASKNISTRIKLDGEKEFRQSIKQCNSSLKLMSQEMKNLKEVYKDSENSTLGLIEKEKILGNQKKLLAEKVATLEKALDKARESYDENSTKVQGYKKSLLEAQNALIKIDREIEENKKALKDTRRIYEENNKSIKELVLKQAEAEKQYGKNSEEAKKYAKQIEELKNEQKKLMGEMNADRLKEISNQYTLNADRLKDLKEEYKEVVKVFGENSSEADRLKREISQLEQEQSKLNAELKKNELRNLTKQYEQNKDAIKALKAEYKQTKDYLGENSDSAKKLKEQLSKLETEQKQLKSSMNKCSKEIEQEEKAFRDLGNEAKETEKKIGTFGKILLANLASNAIQKGLDVISDGIRNLAGSVVDSGANFKSAMGQVSATMGITAQDIQNTSSEGYRAYKKLEDSAKGCGRTTKFSASEAAEGLNYMALAGYSVEEATKTLPSVLNLAAAGAYDLGTASDQLTDLLTALGYSVDYAETMVDQMAKTSQKSNTTVKDLGDGILRVGGTAKGMAGGTHELCTALGLLADNGIHAAEGGTKLRNILLALNPTTDKAVEAWEQLGVSGYDANGNLRPLQDTCMDLNNAMADMSAQERKKILSKMFNKTDLIAVEALLGTTKERWVELDGEIVNSQGCAEDMADTLNNNLKGKMVLMQSALEGLGISIFEKFDKPFQNVVEHVTEGVGAFDQAVSSNTKISKSFDEAGSALEDLGTTLVDSIISSLPSLLSILGTLLTTTSNVIKVVGNVGSTIGNTLGITDNFSETLSRLASVFITIVPAITAFKVAMKAMKLMEEAKGASSFISSLKELSGVTKIATTTQQIFNTVVSMNPLVLVAGVLATVITAYAGYNAMLDITGAKEGQVSRETEELKDRLKELRESADNCQIDIQTNTDELLAQKEAMSQNITELFKLANQKDKSNSTILQEKNLVDQLNSAYPELNLQINEQTGAINQTEEAVRSYINTAMEQAKLKAIQEQMTESYKRQLEEEQKLEQAKAKEVELDNKVSEAKNKLTEANNSHNRSYSSNRKAIKEATEGLADATAEQKANKQAIEDGTKALNKEKENVEFLNGKLEETSQAVDKNTQAQKKQEKATESTSKAIQEQIEWTEDAQEAFNKYCEQVEKDTEKQITLNDKWSDSTELTGKKIIQNYQSQAEGQAKYAENYQKTLKLYSQDYIKYLQDTGQDTAENIKVLARQSKEGAENIESAWKKSLENGNKVIRAKEDARTDIIDEAMREQTQVTQKGTDSQVKAVNNGEKEKAQAVKSGEAKSTKEVKNAVKENNKARNDEAKGAKTAGANASKAHADGISSGKSKVKTATKEVVNTADKELKDGSKKAKKNGQDTTNNFSEGVKSGKNKAKQSASDVGNSVEKELDKQSKKAKNTGEKVTKNLSTGIESKKSEAKNSLEKVGIEMATQNQQMFVRGNSLGKYFVDGFINGMENKKSSLVAKAQELSSAVENTTRSTLDIHSPSRVGVALGQFYVEGMAQGIGKIDKVKKATTKLSKTIVDSTKSKSSKKELKKSGEEIAEAVFDGVRESCNKNKKKKLDKELFDTANVKMDYLKKTNKITLNEELAFWKEILQHSTKGSKEYNKILDKISDTKKRAEEKITEITKTYTDRASDALDKYKRRHDVSVAEEISYWTSIREITKKGTDEYKEITNKISELNDQLYKERKEILNNLETAEKEYNTKCKERNEELSNSLKQLEVEYKNSVQSISESIQSALGLFDKFESSTDKTSKDLIDNMYSQVLASEQYYDTMEKLRKRGVSENLLEDLQQAGIKDLETLKVIANMTDNELQQFQRLYDKRNDFATREARNEVDKDDFEAKRKELIKQAQADLKTYETELKTQTKTLENQLRATYNSVDKELQSKANTMVRNFKNAIKKYCSTDVAKKGMGYMGTTTVRETNKKGMECKSAGRNLVNQMANGLKSGQGYLANVAASVVSSAIEAMKQAGDIHSPSRKTKDLIGKNLALGVSEGFKGSISSVKEDMKNGLIESINGMADASVPALDDVISSSFKFDASSISKITQDNAKKLNFNTPNYSSNSNYNIKNNFNLTEVVNKLAELGNKIDKVGTALNDKQVTLDGRVIGKFVDGRLSKSIR